MKTCNKCNIEKPLTEYYKNRNRGDGYQTYCIPCHKAVGEAYRDNYMERFNNKYIEVEGTHIKYCGICMIYFPIDNYNYNLSSVDGLGKYCIPCTSLRANQKAKEKWANNPEPIRAASKKYRNNNKDKISNKHKEYYKENKVAINAKTKKWHDENPEKLADISSKWQAKEYTTNENFRLAHLARTRVYHAIKYWLTTGTIRVSKKEDYPIDYGGIISHIGPIPGGTHYGLPYDNLSMSIDHLCPIRSFDLESPHQWRAAVHPENYRWCTRIENYNRIWNDDIDIEAHRSYLLEKTRR